MTPRPAHSYTLRFTLCALLILLVTKAGFGLTGAFGEEVVPNLSSYFQDAMLVLLSAGILVLVERVAPIRFKPGFRIAFILWVALLTAMSLAYTPLIPDIVRQPVNVFALDPAVITFSAGLFVSPLVFASGLGFAALLFGLPVLLAARLRPAWPWILSACVLQVALFVGSMWKPAVSPLVYTLMDEASSIGRRIHNPYHIGKLEPSAEATTGTDYSFLFRPRQAPPAATPRYSRVLVLVMESVNYDLLMGRFGDPDAEFPKRTKDHCVSFSNYHCLNLESYTGLLTLLNSVFIPYRAYGNDSTFSFVNFRDNLLRDMRREGFTPWFVSSYGAWQGRFVPDPPDWEGIVLKDPAKNTGFISVDSNAMERALEDFAVLEDVVDLCRRPGRTFIMQEMVCGHSPIWTQETGVEPLTYYDRYFSKLYDRLKEEGLLEGTLIAITSDHGPRPHPTDPNSYRLPLLLIAPDLKAGEERGFFSHLDFADILWARIAGQPTPRGAERVFVVGSTVGFVYGMLGREGAYALIDDHTFRVGTDLPADQIGPFHEQFEGYLSFFDAQRRAAGPLPSEPPGGHVILK
jgi:hypothetical protein